MRIQTAPMPPTTDERTPVGQTVWTWACVLLIVGFHCFIQWRNFGPAHVEHDLDGYTWLAKRIATLGPLTVKPDNPFQYQSHVWVENAKGEVTAKYAPGHPIMMAIGYRLFGEEGIYYVSPVASALSLIGAFLLFRLWMGTIASLLALLTLSIHGMILFYGGYLLSHALDLCLVTWGMYFLWRWMEKPSFRWAVGAGLTLGYAVMVRHTNALLAACILAAIATALWRQLREQGQIRWRPVLALLGTYAIFPLVLAVYDTVLFGRPYITGYSLSDEQGAFKWGMLYGNYGSFMNNAFNNYLYVCLPLGGLGILMLGRWPEKLMRLLWVLPLTVLYASYYWYVPYGGFYRFLLSLTPVFIGNDLRALGARGRERCRALPGHDGRDSPDGVQLLSLDPGREEHLAGTHAPPARQRQLHRVPCPEHDDPTRCPDFYSGHARHVRRYVPAVFRCSTSRRSSPRTASRASPSPRPTRSRSFAVAEARPGSSRRAWRSSTTSMRRPRPRSLRR